MKTELPRLLRIAADRNRREEYGGLIIRLLRSDIRALRARLATDRMSPNVLIEALVRGYLANDPAMVAALEDWMRRERPSAPVPRPKKQSKRELDDIYDELEGDTMDTEDT